MLISGGCQEQDLVGEGSTRARSARGNGFLTGQYGRGPVEFFQILADWRAEGELRGLDVTLADPG